MSTFMAQRVTFTPSKMTAVMVIAMAQQANPSTIMCTPLSKRNRSKLMVRAGASIGTFTTMARCGWLVGETYLPGFHLASGR
mmetsp:Transcript_12628/g.19978  ORF Transcript_12628/g.19978 Transcript_12628/m.19978 type:complete len:82 (+) Transcript_12628:53-298(+)